MADQAASGRDPVMGPRDLGGHVVERFDADVVRLEGEDAGGLPGRDPAELRDDHLDHEVPAGFQVRGRVGEDCYLVAAKSFPVQSTGCPVRSASAYMKQSSK